MLQLKNIVKKYKIADTVTTALGGVSLGFRESEFVSILGPSGSGKTTLLNIIGGLDRYTDGDLVINGVSTKKYSDRDWDTYRNHTIGFVFQSYNLIPHQSVLSNVEIAMTLAGVGAAERKKRALDALNKVGLSEHVTKRPNQLSGGQMQRVAIARALVNDPDILLADEPTGALDSATGIAVMEILKEIAADRLVIMVTHNPELAEKYSTRIIKLSDGVITDDSDPYDPESEKGKDDTGVKIRKTRMSLLTALSLSLNNLGTKRARTVLTSFAGSIGIIGIALILALSSGLNAYIKRTEEDTLSSYPITISAQALDMTDMEEQSEENREIMRRRADEASGHSGESGLVYQNGFVGDLLKRTSVQISSNDLRHFKEWLESEDGRSISGNTTAISYGYGVDPLIYAVSDDGTTRINPTPLRQRGTIAGMTAMGNLMGINTGIWSEMLGSSSVIADQYDVLAGRWPEKADEVVIIVSENNEISDFVLYSLGLKDLDEYEKIRKEVEENGEADRDEYEAASFTYDDILGLRYRLVIPTDLYEEDGGIWRDRSGDEDFAAEAARNGIEISVVGILRPNSDAAATSLDGTVGYTKELTLQIIDEINASAVVKAQKDSPDINIFTGSEFVDTEGWDQSDLLASMSPEQQAQLMTMGEAERQAYISSYARTLSATYESNIETLGAVDLDEPTQINLYLSEFAARDAVIEAIEQYNIECRENGEEEYVITYTDLVGVMMSSITRIINMITYILIAFVSISLVVSSLMIGIITYISVLERTKEIGILRAVGASKGDIRRVFNAETAIIGFCSGLIGVGIAWLITFPANAIIDRLAGVSGIARLPLSGALALIALSTVLTLIAGLIPSGAAARKDPVTALRTE